MRILIPFLGFALIGCKSHKQMIVNQSQQTDSIAHIERHRTLYRLDSLIRSVEFKFDTLELSFLPPILNSVNDSTPSISHLTANTFIPNPFGIISLKATNGHLLNNTINRQSQISSTDILDTVSFHETTHNELSENRDSSQIYEPPAGGIVILAAAILIFLIFLFNRKK